MVRLLISASLVLNGCNSATVVTGVDYSNTADYKCQSRGTAHIGLDGEFYRTPDERFVVSGGYLRQACAMDVTGSNIDSVKIDAKYKIWQR